MGLLRILHVSLVFRSLGGIEALLRQHHQKDERWGIDSHFMVLSETGQTEGARVHSLRLKGWRTVAQAQARIRRVVEQVQPQVIVYHGMASMRVFCCEADRASRRIGFLHGVGNRPETEQYLRSRRLWIDGIISVDAEAANLAQAALPDLEPDRVCVLPLPLSPSHLASPLPDWGKRPVVLGYSGRLIKEHKRVDRLPIICSHLDEQQLDYRLEILGEGPDRQWLESQLADNPRVKFHGRCGGDDYWRILNQWDLLVFTSDTEGQPMALLEGMSCGVIPVFPKINSGGDPYVIRADPRLLTPSTAPRLAAELIVRLAREPADEIEALRMKCKRAVASNTEEAYFGRFAEFLRYVVDAPRSSKDMFHKRPALANYCPLGLLPWIARVRSGFLRSPPEPARPSPTT